MDCSAEDGVTIPAFLRRTPAQSGFEDALGECNAIRSWGFSHSELTSAGSLDPSSAMTLLITGSDFLMDGGVTAEVNS
jgi:hypothetical protein